MISSPARAEVLVDGSPVGHTPLQRTDIDNGEHVITVRATGYYDFQKGIVVRAGEMQVIKTDLEPIGSRPTAQEPLAMDVALGIAALSPVLSDAVRTALVARVGFGRSWDGRPTFKYQVLISGMLAQTGESSDVAGPEANVVGLMATVRLRWSSSHLAFNFGLAGTTVSYDDVAHDRIWGPLFGGRFGIGAPFGVFGAVEAEQAFDDGATVLGSVGVYVLR